MPIYTPLPKPARLYIKKCSHCDLKYFGKTVSEEIEQYPMNIIYITRDLHNSDYKGNIMTEFEEKFSKLGNKINKLTATFKEKKNG